MAEVSETIRRVADALERSGVISSCAVARTLVAWATGVELASLVLTPPLTRGQMRQVEAGIESIIAGVPVQHVTGVAFFRTVSVHVGQGVFIPRPETECLAGWAIDAVRDGHRRVVELCAGSGAISLAILAESRPDALWAVEKSETACEYLAENLAGTPAVVVNADMSVTLSELNDSIDVVVANPPYVPDGLRCALPANVTHDPDEALFSGVDGLDATRLIATTAWRLLRPGGVLGSEHGDDQADAVVSLFELAGFTRLESHKDLTGRSRYVTGVK